MEGYMTIKQTAEEWGGRHRTGSVISGGRIEGATKFGRDWAIPTDAIKPVDKRITTGKYKNWRKRKNSIRMT